MLRTLSVATNATTTDDEMKANLEYERKAAIRKKNANRAEERSKASSPDEEPDQVMVEAADKLMEEMNAQCVSKYYALSFLLPLTLPPLLLPRNRPLSWKKMALLRRKRKP